MNRNWRGRYFGRANCRGKLRSIASAVTRRLRTAIGARGVGNRIWRFTVDVVTALVTAAGLFLGTVLISAIFLAVGVWLILFLWGYVP